jgi:hypothetical protein
MNCCFCKSKLELNYYSREYCCLKCKRFTIDKNGWLWRVRLDRVKGYSIYLYERNSKEFETYIYKGGNLIKTTFMKIKDLENCANDIYKMLDRVELELLLG